MTNRESFTHIDADLLPVYQEIRAQEPIFHTAAFGTTRAEFEKRMAPDYWEVGASGRRYSRDFILQFMKERPPVDAAGVGWQDYDHGLRRLGPDTYLFTYTLRQGQRITRRATIWQGGTEGWRILYHQGTVASVEEDDTEPPSLA
jgi:hypothetical protein